MPSHYRSAGNTNDKQYTQAECERMHKDCMKKEGQEQDECEKQLKPYCSQYYENDQYSQYNNKVNMKRY